ncbi:MAG: 3-dehydroquinate synthase [Nitrospira sp.]|nr:MAG: 3-dehydroquinate synthase [Nitrospira sp.]
MRRPGPQLWPRVAHPARLAARPPRDGDQFLAAHGCLADGHAHDLITAVSHLAEFLLQRGRLRGGEQFVVVRRDRCVRVPLQNDDHLFASLEENIEPIVKRDDELVANVVARSCRIKASVVEQDERESGLRRILNYGHTIGHALESLGRYRRLIHGEAVAIGMVQEALLARRLGLCSDDVVVRQRRLITQAGLPTDVPSVRFATLWTAMQHDKKVSRGRVQCVLPRAIGQVEVRPLERQDVEGWFREQAREGRRTQPPRRRG